MVLKCPTTTAIGRPRHCGRGVTPGCRSGITCYIPALGEPWRTEQCNGTEIANWYPTPRTRSLPSVDGRIDLLHCCLGHRRSFVEEDRHPSDLGHQRRRRGGAGHQCDGESTHAPHRHQGHCGGTPHQSEWDWRQGDSGDIDGNQCDDGERVSGQGGRWLSRRHHHLGHRRPWHLAASQSGRFGNQLWPEHWPIGHSLWDSGSGADCSGPWHPRPRRQPRHRQRPVAQLLSRCQVSGGLGAIAPQGPSHRHQEDSQQHEWQSQRAHMRHRDAFVDR